MQNLVQIHDNILDGQSLRWTYEWCTTSPMTYDQNGEPSAMVRTQTRFSRHFNPEDQPIIYAPIVKKIQSVVDLKLELTKCYLNFYDFSTPTVIHQDAFLTSEGITAIFFPNHYWHYDWGGEILFYNDYYEVIQGVSFKPNRLLLFDSGIPHCVKQPSVNATIPRYSIAFKYDILKDD